MIWYAGEVQEARRNVAFLSSTGTLPRTQHWNHWIRESTSRPWSVLVTLRHVSYNYCHESFHSCLSFNSHFADAHFYPRILFIISLHSTSRYILHSLKSSMFYASAATCPSRTCLIVHIRLLVTQIFRSMFPILDAQLHSNLYQK